MDSKKTHEIIFFFYLIQSTYAIPIGLLQICLSLDALAAQIRFQTVFCHKQHTNVLLSISCLYFIYNTAFLELSCGNFFPMHPVEHLWGQALMLDKKSWFTISVPLPPKSVQWVWCQGFVQASQILPHQTHPTMSLWALHCSQRHSHAEIGKSLPQSIPSKLEA